MYNTDDPLVSYLEVVEATDAAETLIEHLRSYDTHEALSVPTGIFEIRRQREYVPEGAGGAWRIEVRRRQATAEAEALRARLAPNARSPSDLHE